MQGGIKLWALRAICGLLLLALCGGCGMLPGSSLEKRAAQYYNYMVGRQPQLKYSSFISPAYRATMGREGIKTLDAAKSGGQEANERYPAAKAADISVSREGQFAYSMVRPELGAAFASVGAVKWVRAGSGWYLYMGSESERQKYGPFPESLSPREPPSSDPAQ